MEGAPVLRLLFSNLLATYAPPKRWRWALLALFAAHWALGAALGLSVDEAHYALYAAHPALSYFDHPPLVGWVQWPLVALNAPTAVLRLIPGVLWLLTVLLVYALALRLDTGSAQQRVRAGVWAVLVLLLAPLLHILGIGLLPDTLLMLWSVALMLQTLRMMEMNAAQLQRPLPWLVLGAVLGLAGLSKYTAIFSALAVALCLLRVHGLSLLRNGWLWIACLLALLLISPVLIWNAQHQWISFVYQVRHGAGGGWHVLEEARFLLIQWLAYGALLWWGLRGVIQVAPRLRWLAAFFVVPFGVLAVMAGGGSSLPHWTAPAWVALAPFAGIALAARQGRSAVVRGLAAFQLLACLALPVLLLSAGMPWMEGKVASAQSSDPPNPFADLHGWDAAGARALTLAQQHGLDTVAVQNWTLASRIGWYARPLKVQVLEDRFDQFDLWAGKLPVGGSALLVDWSQLPYQTPMGAHGFAQCQAVDRVDVQRFGFAVAHFDFYACSGWSGQPQPVLKSDPGASP
jgi:hypothetical protein